MWKHKVASIMYIFLGLLLIVVAIGIHFYNTSNKHGRMEVEATIVKVKHSTLKSTGEDAYSIVYEYKPGNSVYQGVETRDERCQVGDTFTVLVDPEDYASVYKPYGLLPVGSVMKWGFVSLVAGIAYGFLYRLRK